MSYGSCGGYSMGGSPASSYASGSCGGLESIAASYAGDPGLNYISASGGMSASYSASATSYGAGTTGNYGGYTAPHQAEQQSAFIADDFLDPFRPPTPFVGDAETIRPHVEEAFEALTGAKLPADVIIRVGTEQQCARAYPGDWQNNIRGFAVNRVGWGTSEIFVVHDNMDRLLLTVGHELGHVMSKSLPRELDEEAKAFAFSAAWMKIIKQRNIAGIGHAINPTPAKNGLHNVACNFVMDLIERGKDALAVFVELANRLITV
jgi:hypothetical protein